MKTKMTEEERKKSAAESRIRSRAIRKKRGICRLCKAKVEPGRVFCEQHLVSLAKKQKDRRAEEKIILDALRCCVTCEFFSERTRYCSIRADSKEMSRSQKCENWQMFNAEKNAEHNSAQKK